MAMGKEQFDKYHFFFGVHFGFLRAGNSAPLCDNEKKIGGQDKLLLPVDGQPPNVLGVGFCLGGSLSLSTARSGPLPYCRNWLKMERNCAFRICAL